MPTTSKSPSDAKGLYGDFTIAILSYNRGGYLLNCVDSCLRNMPGCAVRIYDDQSDDPATAGALKIARDRGCEVISSETVLDKERHGGLYANMQRALADCDSPYLVYLQDDTQIVRRVDGPTIALIAETFTDADVAFIRSQFFKQMDMHRFRAHFPEQIRGDILEPIGRYRDCDIDHAYCDIMIADARKLKAAGWTFRPNERANQILARSLFKFMPYLRHPFVFYCPEVPSYRDRKLYLASRIVQKSRNGRIVRLNDLDGDRLEAFLNRPQSEFPIAEDWLTADLPDVIRPFVFQDYSRTRWLTVLYKVESRLWRMWKPFRRLMRR
jgi:glycosyltransferase involved in cell wall biosynthesis